jgi:cyanophycinase
VRHDQKFHPASEPATVTRQPDLLLAGDRSALVPFAILLAVAAGVLPAASRAEGPAAGSNNATAEARADRPLHGPAEGALVIVGGGQIGPDVAKEFVSRAGGSEGAVVVIPTANDHPDAVAKAAAQVREAFGLRNVTVLHTKNRAEADSEAFVAPLKNARGVWLGGGRHWRLVDSYLGTRTEREIKAVLERGGVVGGSSAGATILGSFLVRGAREGNHIMVAKDYQQGFGCLKDVAIDQHILPRRRAGDLSAVVADRAGLLGLGIDESTAIVVEGDRFEVVGRGVVAVHDGRDHDGRAYYFLGPGERFDLAARRRVNGDSPSQTGE